MIYIGLTTWSEHPELMQLPKLTLKEYASRLPLVEIDTPFYGIPREETVKKWVQDTPESFRFLIKGHQAMTLQGDWQTSFASEEAMYQLYLTAMQPVITSKKVLAFLFQFPAYFSCTKENVNHLKKIRQIFKGLPIAVEFRSATWYDSTYKEKMLNFMKVQQITLVTVDEPQVPTNPVPFIPESTTSKLAILRLHGRNLTGWLDKGPDWRKKRTLYRYTSPELTELALVTEQLSEKAQQIAVIFNNNSGGDAAANAKEFQQLLDLNPQQLDLFGE